MGKGKRGGGQKFLAPPSILISSSWCPASTLHHFSFSPALVPFIPLLLPHFYACPFPSLILLPFLYSFSASPIFSPSLFLLFLADLSSPFISLGHSPHLPSLSLLLVHQAPYSWFPLPHLPSLYQLLIQGTLAQAVTSRGTKGNFFIMFLASSLGVRLAIYISGNVSGKEGEVWSSDGVGLCT